MDYRRAAILKQTQPYTKEEDLDLEDKARAAVQGVAGDVSIIPAGIGAAVGNVVGQEGDNEARYQALKAKLGIREPVKEGISAFEQGVLEEDAKNKAAVEKYPVIENVGLAAGVVGNPAKLLQKGAKLAQKAGSEASNVVSAVKGVPDSNWIKNWAANVGKTTAKETDRLEDVAGGVSSGKEYFDDALLETKKRLLEQGVNFDNLSQATKDMIIQNIDKPVAYGNKVKLGVDEGLSSIGKKEAIRDVATVTNPIDEASDLSRQIQMKVGPTHEAAQIQTILGGIEMFPADKQREILLRARKYLSK